MYALGKTHMRYNPCLISSPNVAFETVLVFVCLTMALSRLLKSQTNKQFERFFFLRVSSPDSQWCDGVLCLVSASHPDITVMTDWA